MRATRFASLMIGLGACAGPEPVSSLRTPTPLAEAQEVDAQASPSTSAATSLRDTSGPLEGVSEAEALELAAANRPELAAAQARVRAAGGRVQAAGRLPNPNLYVLAEQVPLSSDEFDTAQYLLGVTQSVPIGGRLRRAEDAAERELEAAAAEVLAAARAVRRDVRGAFVTALYGSEALTLAAEVSAIAREELAIAQARRELGDAIPSELAALELALARARSEERRAASLDARARAALSSAVGLGARELESVTGELTATLALPELELLLGKLESDPELLAALARSEAAAARVELADARRVPDLRFDLAYRRVEIVQQDTFDVGLAINVPLFDSGSGRVEASRAELLEARAAERSARLYAESEVREAYLEAAQALELVRFQRDEVLPLTLTWIETVRARHAAGDVGGVELLGARRAEVDAQLVTLEAQRSLMAAWARLAPYLEL